MTTVNTLLDAKVDDTEMVNYATNADTFTKGEVNQKFTDIIAGAPNALNTPKELSDALGADENVSATVSDKINSKSNQLTVSSPLLLELNPTNPELLNELTDVYNKAETGDKYSLNATATNFYTKMKTDDKL